MASDFSGLAAQGLVSPSNGTSGSDAQNATLSFTRGSIRYDSPFLDMTSSFLPKQIKGILRFLAAYIVGDGLVAQCITKMAEYPITDFLYEEKVKSSISTTNVIDRWKMLLENKMNLSRVIKQAGMDYYGYGNSIISINYPFKRILMCPRCHKEHAADSLKLTFRAFKFYGECITVHSNGQKCGYKGEMKARDMNTKEHDKISIVHWDILCIDIKYNSITGEHFYFYTIPTDLASAIKRGDMDIINSLRLEVIEAVRIRKQLKLVADNVYHLKRTAPQYMIPSERGWGIPLVMPVLKDLFHIRILKKGNEMIAFDHIVPLRILFPVGTGDVSPHATISLSGWRLKIEEEIRKWRADPNYVSIVPIPLGMTNFSGDARMLLTTPEIRATEDTVITGLGIAPEIIRGGASWSGSNVSMRVIENTFLNHRNDIEELIDWIVEGVARHFDMPKIKVTMSDFKMADDLAKKQLMVQSAMGSASASLVSKTTCIKELGFDPEIEKKNKMEELKTDLEIAMQEAEGQAEVQGSAALINAAYAADAQIEGQNRLEKGQSESDQKRDAANQDAKAQNAQGVQQEVSMLAQQNGQDVSQMSLPNFILNITNRFARMSTMDPEEFKMRMLAMKNSMPSLYSEVYNNLKEMNLIVADTLPDLNMAQKYTPGQIPQNTQGDTRADETTSPASAGASPQKIDAPLPAGDKPVAVPTPNPLVATAKIKPLNEVRPPSGKNASI